MPIKPKRRKTLPQGVKDWLAGWARFRSQYEAAAYAQARKKQREAARKT